MALVSPSILAADWRNLPEEIRKMEEAGATFIHVDVMDGVFVRRKTFDPSVLDAFKAFPNLIRDVHLMVKDVEGNIRAYAAKGATIITFHLEACKNSAEAHYFIQLIHSLGVKAGMSIRPGTPVESLFPYFEELDLILIMSVEPGEGGQPFQMASLSRLDAIKQKAVETGHDLYIQVDGGINEITAPLVVKAGANLLVSGSYLYGSPSYQRRLKELLAL